MNIVDKNNRTIDDPETGHVMVIDKPLEWTSSDVVRKLKYFLQRKGYRKIKIGHAGTLDPLATGILLVCIGKATKQVDALQGQPKEYVTEMTLGASTPSLDMEHPVDRTYPHEHITLPAIEAALAGLTGERLQVPPLYSAKMVEGRRAYELAREGSDMELRGALINIYSMEVVDYVHPKVVVRVRCSKGTYIRSLAREVGEALDSGAYLSGLRRTASGNFVVADALSVDDAINILSEVKQKANSNV